jgi:hypothetical protein
MERVGGCVGVFLLVAAQGDRTLAVCLAMKGSGSKKQVENERLLGRDDMSMLQYNVWRRLTR